MGGVGAVRYPGPFLFGGNVAIKKLNVTIEIADHLPDLHRVPLRGFASIKMTLGFLACYKMSRSRGISAGP